MRNKTFKTDFVRNIYPFHFYISNEVQDDSEQQKEEQEKMRKMEKTKKWREENYLKEKENWETKRKEYSVRAARFADLKRRRREEKRKMENTRKVLESDDLWEEIGETNFVSLINKLLGQL